MPEIFSARKEPHDHNDSHHKESGKDDENNFPCVHTPTENFSFISVTGRKRIAERIPYGIATGLFNRGFFGFFENFTDLSIKSGKDSILSGGSCIRIITDVRPFNLVINAGVIAALLLRQDVLIQRKNGKDQTVIAVFSVSFSPGADRK